MSPTSEGITLIEGGVLGLLLDEPRHGFALAKEFEPDGPIGMFFTARPPMVYRAINTLTAKNLLEVSYAQSSTSGPQRVVMHATRKGRRRITGWLQEPVEHMRQIRVDFMLKLALLDRLGLDPQPLIRRQFDQLEPIYAAQRAADLSEVAGFARMLAVWRIESSAGVMQFLRTIRVAGDA